MRVSDLINLASQYLKMGIAAALFIILCIFIGYFVVYRKLLRGQKKVTWKRFLWWGIFICYLCVVLGATLFSRGNYLYNGKIVPLFYSYKEAWIHFSDSAWRNIILNFCMFVPLGFWLPLGIRRFRSFWKTYLAGFGCSLLIECVQLFLRRGIFELDDIMGNTIGTMIGYGFFSFGFFLVGRKASREERKYRHAVSILFLQVPLLLTCAAFAVIFWKYNARELGNNPYRYIEAYDSARLQVTAENTFRTEKPELEVYKVTTLTVEAAEEKGEQIFKALGTTTDTSRTDVYDETIVLYSEMGGYSLWIDYQGGTMEFTNFDVLYPNDHITPEPVTGAKEDEIRSALYAIGFKVPESAAFRESKPGTYCFDATMSETEAGLVNGTFTCEYYGAEKGFGKITDSLIAGTPYKAYAAISEQDAYEQLAKGEFAWLGNGYLEIQVTSCSLAYTLDSKGYYQPNYAFACTINEEESRIMIPALRD